MGELLAVLTAVAFAFGTVLQQKGTMTTRAGEKDPRFLVEILHTPVWLAGLSFQICGWILQAMALDRASLVVVQSLVSLSLVIALRLGGWLTDQHIGRREVAGAALTLAGIACFLSAGQPQGGTEHPGARTKTFVTHVGGGLLGLLTTWSSYVLLVTAVLGFGLQQSALKTGLLAPAMASSNSVTLFASVVLGFGVYGEALARSGGAHPAFAIAGLLVAGVGIVLLGGSSRPNEPDPAPIESSA